jgi:hypothetical protein
MPLPGNHDNRLYHSLRSLISFLFGLVLLWNVKISISGGYNFKKCNIISVH